MKQLFCKWQGNIATLLYSSSRLAWSMLKMHPSFSFVLMFSVTGVRVRIQLVTSTLITMLLLLLRFPHSILLPSNMPWVTARPISLRIVPHLFMVTALIGSAVVSNRTSSFRWSNSSYAMSVMMTRWSSFTHMGARLTTEFSLLVSCDLCSWLRGARGIVVAHNLYVVVVMTERRWPGLTFLSGVVTGMRVGVRRVRVRVRGDGGW